MIFLIRQFHQKTFNQNMTKIRPDTIWGANLKNVGCDIWKCLELITGNGEKNSLDGIIVNKPKKPSYIQVTFYQKKNNPMLTMT